MRYVAPAINETAFNCPHCGALAKQSWFSAHADALQRNETPFVVDDAFIASLKLEKIEDDATRKSMQDYVQKAKSGRPFLHGKSVYRDLDVANLWFSKCFNCDEIAIWFNDRLAYPLLGQAPAPSPDMPADIRIDYEEASTILDLSPRGAAALTRLCIEKLCKHLGQNGRDINADIAALVAAGLDPRVQKALDAVRVIGNEAVHPGQIDLRDDRSIAVSLFKLVNLIVEKMISEPKHVEEVYNSLPDRAKAAIERRDAKAKGQG